MARVCGAFVGFGKLVTALRLKHGFEMAGKIFSVLDSARFSATDTDARGW
jgi:hypothetical protein